MKENRDNKIGLLYLKKKSYFGEICQKELNPIKHGGEGGKLFILLSYQTFVLLYLYPYLSILMSYHTSILSHLCPLILPFYHTFLLSHFCQIIPLSYQTTVVPFFCPTGWSNWNGISFDLITPARRHPMKSDRSPFSPDIWTFWYIVLKIPTDFT